MTTEPPLKRLRGGGFGDDDNDDELIHDDGFMDEDDQLDDSFQFTQISDEFEDYGLSAKDLEMQSRWARPMVDPNFTPAEHDLHLQWMDMDMTVGPPLESNPHEGRKVLGVTTNPIVPIIRIYGVNNAGNSVTLFVHGFVPYAYFSLPADCPIMQHKNNRDALNKHLHEVREQLNIRLAQAVSRNGDPFKGHSSKETPKYCVGCQLVTDHCSLMGYNTQDTQFLKVILAMPTLVPTLKRLMEEGKDMVIDAIMPTTQRNSYEAVSWNPFECNVPFVLRYMIDNQIDGSGWLTLPKKLYRIRSNSEKTTHAQIEADISYNDVIYHKSEGEWSRMAPIRVLSVDIECQGRKGHFPEAKFDPVIQIANVVQVYGQAKPIVQNVFTLKGCLPIVGAQVLSSDTETDLLLKWRAFLQAVDPDVITGYNVQVCRESMKY